MDFFKQKQKQKTKKKTQNQSNFFLLDLNETNILVVLHEPAKLPLVWHTQFDIVRWSKAESITKPSILHYYLLYFFI